MLCYAMVPAYNTKHGADGEREGEGGEHPNAAVEFASPSRGDQAL